MVSPQPIPILLYHSISEGATPAFRKWTVHPDRFSCHMEYLYDAGFTALTISDLGSRLDTQRVLPDKPIAITFDDGFADFATAAVPTLRRHEHPVTVFITTKYVGETSRWLERQGEADRRFMTWDEITSLDEGLVEIGAHGHTHTMLDVLPSRMATFEIAESKRILEERLQRPVVTFAYPHGYSSGRVRRTVRDVGFTSACSVAHALGSVAADRFAIPRIVVSADTSVGDLARLIRGEGLRIAPFNERYRTRGWRVTRRAIAAVRRPFSTRLQRGEACDDQ